jgi:hypothetical protein
MRPKDVFEKAIQLKIGGKLEISFPTKKEADSFRVALYTAKRNLRNETVLISRDKTVVTLYRSSGESMIKISEPGEEERTEISQSQEQQTLTALIKEADEMRDKFGWSEETYKEFIKEALGQ